MPAWPPTGARQRLPAVAAAVGSVLIALPSAGEERKDRPPDAIRDSYLTLVAAYRSGEPHLGRKLVIDTLSSWPAQSLTALPRTLEAVRAGSASSLVDDRTLAAAVMLHTEVAFRRVDVKDEVVHTHLETARRLLELLPEPTLVSNLAGRWFLAVGCWFRAAIALDEAQPYLDEAVKRQPGAPDALLALGSLHEITATSRNSVCLTAADCLDSRVLQEYLGVEAERRAREHAAEKYYRRALEAQPEPLEARLRLGRVLARRGSLEHARAELQRVLDASPDPELRYLAHLFLGGLFEQQDRLAAAVDHYRAAATAQPAGQTARVALGHALRRSGERQGEREALAPLLAPFPERIPEDPWWRYASASRACATEAWTALRAEVLR